MKKNVIPLVVIALVVAVLSTGIFYGLIVSRMDGSAPAAATLRFIAAVELEKGRVLKPGDFQLGPAADPGSPSPAPGSPSGTCARDGRAGPRAPR